MSEGIIRAKGRVSTRSALRQQKDRDAHILPHTTLSSRLPIVHLTVTIEVFGSVVQARIGGTSCAKKVRANTLYLCGASISRRDVRHPQTLPILPIPISPTTTTNHLHQQPPPIEGSLTRTCANRKPGVRVTRSHTLWISANLTRRSFPLSAVSFSATGRVHIDRQRHTT